MAASESESRLFDEDEKRMQEILAPGMPVRMPVLQEDEANGQGQQIHKKVDSDRGMEHMSLAPVMFPPPLEASVASAPGPLLVGEDLMMAPGLSLATLPPNTIALPDNLSLGGLSMGSFSGFDASPDANRSKWTASEEALLQTHVSTHGATNWQECARTIPGRTVKQCRERWRNSLDPKIKRADWSEEEDNMLIKYHKIYGNQWTQIAKHIPGRPDNTIKNRWNSTIRRIRRLAKARKNGRALKVNRHRQGVSENSSLFQYVKGVISQQGYSQRYKSLQVDPDIHKKKQRRRRASQSSGSSSSGSGVISGFGLSNGGSITSLTPTSASSLQMAMMQMPGLSTAAAGLAMPLNATMAMQPSAIPGNHLQHIPAQLSMVDPTALALDPTSMALFSDPSLSMLGANFATPLQVERVDVGRKRSRSEISQEDGKVHSTGGSLVPVIPEIGTAANLGDADLRFFEGMARHGQMLANVDLGFDQAGMLADLSNSASGASGGSSATTADASDAIAPPVQILSPLAASGVPARNASHAPPVRVSSANDTPQKARAAVEDGDSAAATAPNN